jgi:hypothetical protein
MADAGESLEYLERIILRMQPAIRAAGMHYNGVRPVDYTKGKRDIYAEWCDNPAEYIQEQQGDVHFWINFHADWYDSVILSKSHPTIEMKSINWDYLLNMICR